MFTMTIRNKILCTAFMTMLLGLTIPVQTASAMTPDGVTPAEEDVCDVLIGGTPGLYGLCVAYCEAQDCDSDAAHSGQCTRRPPNEPVLRNYNRKMAVGDPAMPCLAPPPSPCPCLTEEEAGNTHWTSCDVDESDRLRAGGIDGELFSIDYQGSTCDLSGVTGTVDRYTSLDGEQTAACRSIIDQAVDYDGIRCESEPSDDDEDDGPS